MSFAQLRQAGAALVAMLFVVIETRSSTAGLLEPIDWNAAILTDPRIVTSPACPRIVDTFGPCIAVAVDGTTESTGLSHDGEPVTIVGYAAIAPDDVIYGDLDGDGVEEAVIRVESGGTAGTIGFLLFRDGRTNPSLITARAGNKLFPRIEQGRLLVTQPFYFGFEGNCCPTAAVTEMYIVDGNDVRLLSVPGESPRWSIFGPGGEYRATFPEVVVAGYYRALDHGAFDDAYELLSPTFRVAHPFLEWRDGFVTTRRIEVMTLGSRERIDGDGRQVYEVLVSLAVVDQLPSGERRGRRFAGVWSVIEGPWPGLNLRLNEARIGEVP